jgi:hypothetical protein
MLKRRRLGRAEMNDVDEFKCQQHTKIKYVFYESIAVYVLMNVIDLKEAVEDEDEFIDKKILIICYAPKGETTRRKKLPINKSYEVFFDHDFFYDPFVVCPSHRLLTKKEMERKRSDWMDMPKIYQSDIIARYFHAQVNQVFEINDGERYLIVIKDI